MTFSLNFKILKIFKVFNKMDIDCNQIEDEILLCNVDNDNNIHYYKDGDNCITKKCKDKHTWYIFLTGFCISAVISICIMIFLLKNNNIALNPKSYFLVVFPIIASIGYLISFIIFYAKQHNYTNSCTKKPIKQKITKDVCHKENEKQQLGKNETIADSIGGLHWLVVVSVSVMGIFCVIGLNKKVREKVRENVSEGEGEGESESVS
tara:strand:+ start:140 stop:760 length:621 start_codon:yes stop_codon:yes gene_type:complete